MEFHNLGSGSSLNYLLAVTFSRLTHLNLSFFICKVNDNYKVALKYKNEYVKCPLDIKCSENVIINNIREA